MSVRRPRQRRILAPLLRHGLEIILDALKVCADHYGHAFGRFTALDNKVQGTITTSGVLLGAVLAFVPQPIFITVIRQTPLAQVAVLTLASTALLAMLAGVAFRGEAVAEAVLDMLQLTDTGHHRRSQRLTMPAN